MFRTTITRRPSRLAASALVVAGALAAAAPAGLAHAGSRSDAAPAARSGAARDDVRAYLRAARAADAQLKREAAAINRAVGTRGARSTSGTVAAARAVDLRTLSRALPMGATGRLRDRLLVVHADLFGRHQAMEDFAFPGRAFREYPQRAVQGSDDMQRVRNRLAVGRRLAARFPADLARLEAAARSTPTVARVAEGSRHWLETEAMRAMSSAVVMSCWDGKREIYGRPWVGHRMTVHWSDFSGGERAGTVTRRGKRVAVPFWADDHHTHWRVLTATCGPRKLA